MDGMSSVFMGYIFVTRKEIWKGMLKHFVSVGYIFVTREFVHDERGGGFANVV